ncbi:hypothetical protein CYMTET_8143 [Cymbomonas tetramitiformis]|uniref:Uncharacterized protein n=1 Tax=Cymbomonas tetramitiformis TaxID=36881 RepID=A0AAE0GTU6_9CHLO|nr:hypothetical protein CYMTET_8143 [Cymbomonas tetramitiformis]
MTEEKNLIDLLDKVPEQYLDKGRIPQEVFPLLYQIRVELESGVFHGTRLSLRENMQLRSRSSPPEGFKYLLKYKLAKWCDVVYQHMVERFVTEHTAERLSPTRHERMTTAQRCFSLVRLCHGTDSLSDLRLIKEWAREAAPHIQFASYEELSAQQIMLRERLQVAMQEEPFLSRWQPAVLSLEKLSTDGKPLESSECSETIIMEDIFTRDRFYTGVHACLFLFSHINTKMNL